MTHYGACEVAQSTAPCNAKLEAERCRKKFQQTQSKTYFKAKKKSALAWVRERSGLEACLSSDFVRPVAVEYSRAVFVLVQCSKQGVVFSKAVKWSWFLPFANRKLEHFPFLRVRTFVVSEIFGTCVACSVPVCSRTLWFYRYPKTKRCKNDFPFRGVSLCASVYCRISILGGLWTRRP